MSEITFLLSYFSYKRSNITCHCITSTHHNIFPIWSTPYTFSPITIPIKMITTPPSNPPISTQSHCMISTSIKLLTHYRRIEDIMNSKKLSEMIRKWQRSAAMGRRKSKGHFVVYTKEGKRFVVPLCYLNHPIFRVLLEMAEEEFGSMVHGPLKVPCEEDLMDYIVSLLKRNPPGEVEKALVSITTCRGTSLTSFFPLCQVYNQGTATMVL